MQFEFSISFINSRFLVSVTLIKISIGHFTDIFLPYFIISILVSGVVGSARLYLKSHSASQVYAGFAVGFMLVVIMYSILL